MSMGHKASRALPLCQPQTVAPLLITYYFPAAVLLVEDEVET